MRDAPFYEPHRVPLARPWFDQREVDVAAEVVRSGMLCQGEKVRQFEAAFADMLEVEHAVAVSSGSSALVVAMQAMGLEPGDEVIVPDMTFVSTATAAMYLGATPVLCDIELEHYNIDPAQIETLISDRTRLVVPVHYAGQVAPMEEITEIARRRGLLVLEDAAEAHLARYRGDRYAGTIGDAGIFSFTPTKPMTTGEGGMIVTSDGELAERCRLIRNFGDHDKFAWHTLGFNFRMTDIAAAIGLVQLSKLEDIVALRREKAAYYDTALRDIPHVIRPAVRGPLDCNYQLYTIRFDVEALGMGRDEISTELASRGVGSRLYYPALHKMKVFSRGNDVDFPAALAFEETALSLPIFTAMTRSEQDQVISSIAEVVADSTEGR